MANKKFLLGMLAMALVFGMAFVSCATWSSVGGTSDGHGLFSSAHVVKDGAMEIASYSVILGLFDSGYADYVSKVKKAEAEGKKITSVTTWYYLLTKTVAYSN